MNEMTQAEIRESQARVNELARRAIGHLASEMSGNALYCAREAVKIAELDCEGDIDEDVLAETYAACSALCAAASKLREIAARLPE